MNYLTNYYKNLSEQLQEKVNHLQRILNENEGHASGTHAAITDAIIQHLAQKYPHLNRKGEHSAEARSAAHIRDILNAHKEAPFVDPARAVEAIAPHAIEGNYELTRGLSSEHGSDVMDRRDYDTLVMNNEADFMEDLIGTIEDQLRHHKN
jgi:hypothetical protein